MLRLGVFGFAAGVMEKRPGDQKFMLGKLEDLVAWGRKNSLWPFNFGLS